MDGSTALFHMDCTVALLNLNKAYTNLNKAYINLDKAFVNLVKPTCTLTKPNNAYILNNACINLDSRGSRAKRLGFVAVADSEVAQTQNQPWATTPTDITPDASFVLWLTRAPPKCGVSLGSQNGFSLGEPGNLLLAGFPFGVPLQRKRGLTKNRHSQIGMARRSSCFSLVLGRLFHRVSLMLNELTVGGVQ